MDPEQAQELMQQFAALGYIEDPGADKEKQAESADIEAKYNISRTYLWKNQPGTRLAVAGGTRAAPAVGRPVSLSTRGLLFSKRISAQAERLLLRHLRQCASRITPATTLLLAKNQDRARRFRRWLEGLLAAEAMNPTSPGIYTQIGDAYARLLQWEKAKVGLRKSDRAGRR